MDSDGLGMRGDDSPVAVLPDGLAHPSLGNAIADTLARLIIEGDLEPGAKITETYVANQLNTSRAPVREAFLALANEGLIELYPRRGAAVSALDANDAEDLYRCRMLLEPEACRLAVDLLDAERLGHLDRLYRRMKTATLDAEPAAYLQANIAYHQQLTASCPNALLRHLIETTWNKSLRYWHFQMRLDSSYMTRSLDLHRRLHDAVVAGDGELAAAISRELLEFALARLLDSFSGAEPSVPAD